MQADAGIATFAANGAVVTADYSEARSAYVCRILPTDSATLAPSVELNCPNDALTPRALARKIRLVRSGSEIVLTRELLGSFGESHLEKRSTVSGDATWLVNASRSDVTAFDVTEDASVITSLSGDSAGEGVGGDFGLYLWSPYSTDFIYKADENSLVNAWLSADGSKVAAHWRSFNANTAVWDYSTALIDLEADIWPEGATRSEMIQGWGLGNPFEEERSFDARGARPPCESPLTAGFWLSPTKVTDPTGPASAGCTAGSSRFLYGSVNGSVVQVRIRMNDDGSGYNLRYLDPETQEATPLRSSSGEPIADDIAFFVSDARSKRMFLAHSDGAISLVDFSEELSASKIRPAGGTQRIEELRWYPSANLLAAAFIAEAEKRTFQFLNSDGVIVDALDVSGAWFPLLNGMFDEAGRFFQVVADEVEPAQQQADQPADVDASPIRWWYLRDPASGVRIRATCGDSGDLPAFDPYFTPDLRGSATGRFVGLARLGPTTGADGADTGVTVVDLTAEKCLGKVEHGDEILDFALNADGRLLVTRSKNQAYVWHVPTLSIVKTIHGPTRIVDDSYGLRVVARTDSKHPAIWQIPPEVEAWLAEGVVAAN